MLHNSSESMLNKPRNRC